MTTHVKLISTIILGSLTLITADSRAELWLETSLNPSPAPGLASYTLTLVGDGENIVTIAGLEVHGLVHQVWAEQSDYSVFPEDLDSPLWDSQWDIYDTHLLITDDQRLTNFGEIIETSDGSNPAGLDLKGLFPGTEPIVGLGTFKMSRDGAIALVPESQTPRVELMQLVVPADQCVDVSLVAFGSTSRDGAPIHFVCPEPTAGLILAAGFFMAPRRKSGLS